jgi:hypothetical protein
LTTREQYEDVKRFFEGKNTEVSELANLWQLISYEIVLILTGGTGIWCVSSSVAGQYLDKSQVGRAVAAEAWVLKSLVSFLLKPHVLDTRMRMLNESCDFEEKFSLPPLTSRICCSLKLGILSHLIRCSV